MQECKIVVMGAGGVGKSAITIRFISDVFEENYDPTIEDSYQKKTQVDGEVISMEILDTAGQEEYSGLQDQWIREGDGYVLVYSIDMESSFGDIDQFKKKINRIREGETNPIAVVLVGNKCDLETRRSIPTETAAKYAEVNGWGFMEASALKNINIDKAFHEAVRRIKAAKSKSTTTMQEVGGKQCCHLL